jgi:putative redox protein
MSNQLSAQVTLKEKVRFIGRARSQPLVTIDYFPPLGEGQGWLPLELLLLSLAGCSGQTVISLLRQMEQPVEGLEVHASGWRREEHPTVLSRIELEFVIYGPDVPPEAIERVIALAQERFCPVWVMLKAGTTITSLFQIIRGDATD